MQSLYSQIRRTQWRMGLALFGEIVCVTLAIAFLVSALAILAHAFWAIDVPRDTWSVRWIIGTMVAAIITASIFAYYRTPNREATALELDRRFNLRERLSSALAMELNESSTPFSDALVSDAERRAAQISLADQFSLRPNRFAWLPMAMLVLLAASVFFAGALRPTASTTIAAVDPSEVTQVKNATEQLKRRIEAQRRKANAEGLEESEDFFRKLEAELEQLSKRSDIDRKDAMIAMNDLKKQLEERREQLGSPEQVQRALAQMKDLQSGPADKVTRAMEQGEFGKAKELVKELAERMKDGKLSSDEKQQLQQQLDQMKEQLKNAAQEHEAKKDQLQQQIDQARREGRGEEASKLQQQLNGLEAQDGQMQKMQQMAESLQQAAESMKNGDMQEAADALEELGDELQEMQQQMSEMEELQQSLDELSQSKDQMRCKSCQGNGCQNCQGFGQKNGGKGGSQWGRGRGSGTGEETDIDSNSYDSKVRGDVKRGEIITAGSADGPNRKGVTQQEIQQAISDVLSKETDPLEDQVLPRDQREHAEQYFNELREKN